MQENERKRIARELHDDLQQTLGAIKFNAMAIGDRLLASPQAVPALLEEIDDLASGAIGSTRRIVNNLRPHMLEDLGLVPAVEALAGQFGQYTGIACRLDADADIDDVLAERADLATGLYRVTQEAFNNVLKHARAGRVEIRLTHAPDGQVVLRITDDGCGMADPGLRKAGSFGLMGMRERVRAIGGGLRVDSRPGVGTTVEVTLPQSVLAGAPADESLEGSYLSATQPLAEAANSAHTEQDALGATDSGRPPGVVDTIPGNVAMLDRHGVIRRVNRAWRTFAESNGNPGLQAVGPGVNYLDVCRRDAANDDHAKQALHGLQQVLEGSQATFISVYPCHSPDAQHWYLLHASATPGGGCVVTHIALPSRVDPAPVGWVPAEAASRVRREVLVWSGFGRPAIAGRAHVRRKVAQGQTTSGRCR